MIFVLGEFIGSLVMIAAGGEDLRFYDPSVDDKTYFAGIDRFTAWDRCGQQNGQPNALGKCVSHTFFV